MAAPPELLDSVSVLPGAVVAPALQAGSRAERRMIAAKGLTGPGYDGHTFWDTEAFVLPVLTYTVPDAAAHELRNDHSSPAWKPRIRRARWPRPP